MDVIERLPCAVRLLPTPPTSMGFHNFDDYERLVEAAKQPTEEPTWPCFLAARQVYGVAR